MADRIEKFAADCDRLLSEKQPVQPAKVVAEIKKFRAWIVKHQDENVPDGAKAKLLCAVQQYHKAAQRTPDIAEASHALIEDLLMLPEGKLVTAKAKKAALKWLEEGRQGKTDIAQVDGGEDAPDDSEEGEMWQLIGCDDNGASLCLMDASDGSTLDVTLDDDALAAELSARFESGDEVNVVVVRGRVARSIL